MMRPFKVWNAERSMRKSVTVQSLQDLIAKGKTKLDFQECTTVTVVLEEDGTEVDEEDYFGFLDNNTVLLLLRDGEEWKPRSSVSTDETDFNASSDMEVADGPSAAESAVIKQSHTQQLLRRLRDKPGQVYGLGNKELETILSLPIEQLAKTMGDTKENAQELQEICQQYLDDRQNTAEAMDLLKLYHRAKETKESNVVDSTDGRSAKRKK